MKRFLYSLLCTLLCVAANAQSSYDLNQPFGFATRTSRTDASDAAKYNITGGGAITYEEAKSSASKIVLTSNGTTAMDTEISNAIKYYSVIIFDGSGANGTDFYLSKYISFDGLKNKTLIGVNGARLCTQFYLTSEIQSMLNNYPWEKNGTTYTGVKKGSTSSNSNTFGSLPSGASVGEESEYLTRKALIEYLSDNNEDFRKAGVFQFKNCENFIIRNIKFVGPGPCDVGGYDLMAMTGSTHFWVDHCDFTDGIDGNFDITNNSDYSTVSWCTFSYTDRAYAHMNTNLVGSSDTDGAVNSEGYYLNTTYAYNHWGNKCDQRMPMARSGKIHMLNNYYTCTNNSSSINPRKNSEFYIEGNYFADGVKKVFSQSEAKSYQWISSGSRANVIASSGVSTPPSSGTVTIPYLYDNTLSATNVPTEVGRWAGATLFQNAAAPTISISTDKSSVRQGAAITVSANTTGYPEPVITWYSCTDASKNGAQSVGTGASYKPSTTSVGTFYMYAVAANSEGSATSDVVSYAVTENSDVTWTFADATTGDITNTSSGAALSVIGSDGSVLGYYSSGSVSVSKITEASATVAGEKYSKYLYMGGNGSTSNRYFLTPELSGKGKLTIVYANSVGGTCSIYKGGESTVLTTITPAASTAVTSEEIDLSSGSSALKIVHDGKCYIYAVIWTPVTSSDPSPTPVKADVSEEERDRNTPDGWTNVVLPDITIYKTVNITDKGASTSATDNATAIQAAIDEASSAGGGKVVVPSGTWLSGPIVMKSNVVFHLSAGATLKLLPYGGTGADVAGCYPRTNSSGLNNYAVFMTGEKNMTNVIVEGEGETSVIDGQGTGGWWSDYKNLGTRPGLIRFGSGSAFLFRNFKMQNSPGVNLTLGQSGNAHDFTVHDVIIRNPSSEASTPSHNTDGIPVWGPNVNIYNCDISTGDDNVVCDSHAHHIHAWNIKCGDGHGMSIGSYTSDAHDIIYEDITFNGTGSGFRLKTSADRSGNDQTGTNGAVKNIICRNATMTGCPSPIKITSWYDSDPSDPTTCTSSTVTPTTPEFCNILFQNITADAVDGATSWKHNSPVYMYGRPEMLIHDVTLDNVKINSKRGMFLAYVDPINFINGCNIVNETNPAQRIAVNHQANIVGTYNGSNGESNDETVFSLEVTSSSTLSLAYQGSSSLASYATIEGGSATVYNGKNSETAQNMVSGKEIKLGGSSGSYLKIELTGGKELAAGDIITIDNSGNWKLTTTNSTSNALTINAPYTITGNESPSLVGTSTIYIWKTGGDGDPSSIKTLTITREAPESPDPDPVAVKPAAKKVYDFVVGRDGTMDEAIAAANNASGTGRYLIFVPDGRHKMTGNASFKTKDTYSKDSEHTYYKWDEATGNITSGLWNTSTTYTDNAMTWLNKSNVSIIGQSKDGTEIYNIPYIWGISYTSTLEIRSGSSNTYLQDFTLKNLYAGGANDKGVAVAFYDRGTNTIAKNLNAWSNQDTYVSAATRCYYETSTFAGTVDFICGSGDVWFEQCDLVINDRGGNVITAPSTKSTELWGYVFNHCTISKAEGATLVTDKNWNLGRPWKNAPASTFLYTKMNVLPKDAAWTNMSDNLTIRFHEYGSTNSSGTLLDLSQRSVSDCKGATADNPVLTEVQASHYKVSNVLKGDNNWDPRALTQQVGVSNVQLTGNTLSWDNNDYALCWVVFKDGVFYDDVTENSITLSETGTYTVRAANSMGGLGEESAAKVVEQVYDDVEYVIVSHASKTIEVGETLQLSAQVLPAGADQSVTWSSDKTSVAEVDEDGVVTARAIGTAKITATTANGLSDYCLLTVVAKQSGGDVQKETVVWSCSDSGFITWAKSQKSNNTAIEGSYNGLYGYGAWTNDGSDAITFSHNGVNYRFTGKGLQAGLGGTTNRCFYFTPKQGYDKATVTVAYTAQSTRPMYIVQGGKTLASGEDGASNNVAASISAEITDFTKPVYIYGGNSNKQLYAIFVDYESNASTQTITKYISSAGWASFVPSENVVVPEDVAVYYAKDGSYNGSSVIAVPVETGTTIAKNTGFFINGAEGNHEFAVSNTTPQVINDNMLSCGNNATIADGSLVFGRNYINDVLTVGFFPLASYDISLPEGVVYINGTKLPQYQQQAKAISVVFEEPTPTFIQQTENRNQNSDKQLYNLSGQKVNNNYKGIVIINGRKVWKR